MPTSVCLSEPLCCEVRTRPVKKHPVDMTVESLAYRQMLCADLNPCEDNLKQSYLQQFLFGLEGHDFRANDGCTGV